MKEWICNVKYGNIIDTGSGRYCTETKIAVGRYLIFMDYLIRNHADMYDRPILE
jgi:hypothetical protein